MSLKCNEEGKSLSSETFAKVSLTNLRRQAVPDLSSDLGMNIFKKVRNQTLSCHFKIFVLWNLNILSTCLSLYSGSLSVFLERMFISLVLVFHCSLRTGVRIGRERAPFPSITQERSASAEWGFLSCFTMTTSTSLPPAAPFPLEVSLA